MSAIFSISAWSSGSPRTRPMDRGFAASPGISASSPRIDPIDARVLALFGLKTPDLHLYVQPAPEVLALKDLKTRRDQVQEMLFAEKNRLEHARHASVSRSLRAHVASLRKALAALEAEIAALVKASETLARKAKVMQTLKGVGPATVAALLAYLPELGAPSRSGIACLAGLAPFDDDSGKLLSPHRGLKSRCAQDALHGGARRHPAQSRHAAIRRKSPVGTASPAKSSSPP